MEEKTLMNKSEKRLTFGLHDAVIDGIINRDIPSRTVYVADETERDAYFANEKPGTIAIQYGFKAMWQLKNDGTWETVFERTE